jgi:hypothetical protein
LVATPRLFGLWALLLTGFQIGPVAVAYGDETEVIDLLSAGRIRTSATWCYKRPGPERCRVTLHVKDGSFLLEGAGCGSFRVPVNGSNGRQAAKISGNTITVSVTGKNGTGVNTYELSTDLTQCSHTVECPAGYQAKVFSCSVERNTPTEAIAQQASPGQAVPRRGEQSPLVPATLSQRAKDAEREARARPSESCGDITGVGGSVSSNCPPPSEAQDAHAPRVDAQSYLEAARDLRERDPDYNSLSAAAQTFRRAAVAFQAAGDIARAQAATDEAKRLENSITIADERAGQREARNQCGVLRGNALQCYNRATRLQSSFSGHIAAEGPVGALIDCVKTYCGAMQKSNCPMPLFGKDNAAFCLTTATETPNAGQRKSAAPR